MSPDMATVDAGTTPAQQLAHDLMLAAAWIADHPEVVTDRESVAVINLGYTYTDTDRLQRIIEAFGDDAVIDTDRGTYSQAEIQFGATKVYATFDRDRHCTPRIEGGQVVWDLQLPDAAGAQAA